MSGALVIEATDALCGERVRLTLDGRTIARREVIEGAPGDVFVAPAFWDLQTNGRWGRSFSDAALTVEEVITIVKAQAKMGTARLCPTLITAPFEQTRHGVETIARACEQDEVVGRMVVGIHLEGPCISGLDGYRGAHPIGAVRDPDWDEFQRLQEASGGRVKIVTLAPERTGAIAFVEKLVAEGILVAIGHTAADGETLRAAVDAGARLSTHLGNGIASPLPRHPNAIWQQAAEDRLAASLIADGHHLDDDTLKVLVRAKTPGRVVLVSDASPLAGLPEGTYGAWAVDPAGKVVVAGTPYLAGSNRPISTGVERLVGACGVSVASALVCASVGPAWLLGMEAGELREGDPACVVRFRWVEGRVKLEGTWVDGEWVEGDLEAGVGGGEFGQ